MGDLYANGETASVKVDNIFVGVVFVNEEGKVVQSLPKATNNILPALDSYSWDTWQQPKYNERLKQSYYILQKVFKDD